MQPVLLGTGLDKGKELRLSMIAMSLGICYRSVKENEYALPVGMLCGEQTPAAEKQCPPVRGEMIVMAYMPDQKTDEFLKAIRESGLEPIRLKAVLTETNRFWSFGRLYQELNRESLFMEQRKKTGP